jgi:hypothetical protein
MVNVSLASGIKYQLSMWERSLREIREDSCITASDRHVKVPDRRFGIRSCESECIIDATEMGV